MIKAGKKSVLNKGSKASVYMYELCSHTSGLLTFSTGGPYSLEVILNYLISDIISYISMMTATGSQQLCIFLQVSMGQHLKQGSWKPVRKHHTKSFKYEWQMSVLILKMLRPSSYLPGMRAPEGEGYNWKETERWPGGGPSQKFSSKREHRVHTTRARLVWCQWGQKQKQPGNWPHYRTAIPHNRCSPTRTREFVDKGELNPSATPNPLPFPA